MNRHSGIASAAVFFLSLNQVATAGPLPPPVSSTALRPLPAKFYGVTIDNIAPIKAIVPALEGLGKTPIARVVFDEKETPSYYASAVQKIGQVSYVMGELLDSEYVDTYSVAQYEARTTDFLALGNDVDLWEVGNEVNGEWLGTTSDVVAKVSNAYAQVKAKGYRAELTLYYNKDCWSKADHEMFTWAQANIPENMKQGLDYVLISYYAADCNNLQPDWPAVFGELGQMFPNSKIGMGESGTTNKSILPSYLDSYYSMKVNNPNFIGGNFWWYFMEQMVPDTKADYQILNAAITAN